MFDVTYFDTSLELDPITEQQFTPVLPEERHVFELIGFERSEPDQYRKEGGIKWTFRVFEEDGRTPFVFNDEQYLFFRTTNIDKKTRKPLFTVGYSANDWASALLGRTLGVDAQFSVSELRGKRMSAHVTWKRQAKDKTKWSVELGSFRHVPVAPLQSPVSSAPASVAPESDDVDRKLIISKIEKGIARLKKLDAAAGQQAQAAYDASALADAPLEDLHRLMSEVQVAVDHALDD